MIRRPPRSTPLYSSAASDVYKRQIRCGNALPQIIGTRAAPEPCLQAPKCPRGAFGILRAPSRSSCKRGRGPRNAIRGFPRAAQTQRRRGTSAPSETRLLTRLLEEVWFPGHACQCLLASLFASLFAGKREVPPKGGVGASSRRKQASNLRVAPPPLKYYHPSE